MTEQILARYASGPDQLEAAIEGLAPADLDLALDDDSWTIRQIVQHVVDGDDLWRIGIKAALGDTRSAFDLRWYWELEQDTWAESWNYAGREVEPSLALLRAARCQVVQLLEQTPGAWERSLPFLGSRGETTISLADMVEMQAEHVVGHVDDIRKIRQLHNV